MRCVLRDMNASQLLSAHVTLQNVQYQVYKEVCTVYHNSSTLHTLLARGDMSW